jgi:hypothetical protein
MTTSDIYTVFISIIYFRFKWKTEAQAIFLNLLTVSPSCKRKFVVCPFVDEETNGSYPFADGLNVLTV